MMRPLRLVSTLLLALSASVATASAVPMTTDTPGFHTFTVPTTDLYAIYAYGAQGGNSSQGFGTPGGRGAEAAGDFQLTAGETLNVYVGGAGGTGFGGGGGGGSFVIGPGNTPLVIAGGGGGSSGVPINGGLAGTAGGGWGAARRRRRGQRERRLWQRCRQWRD